MPQSAQRVLAFLALHDRPVHRGQVAGTLWPDTHERRAAASLRSALWRIRRLGHGTLVSSAKHLSLGPGVDVDVRAMVEAAHRLLGAGTANVPSGLSARSDDLDVFLLAASEWDELLPDWYDDWVLMERERLRQVRLHALEALGARLIEAGRAGRAVEIGLMAAAEEPLRESAHRLLIRAHLAEGNVSEAIRQYRSYRRLLWDELGVAPSAKLEELVPLFAEPVRAGDGARA